VESTRKFALALVPPSPHAISPSPSPLLLPSLPFSGRCRAAPTRLARPQHARLPLPGMASPSRRPRPTRPPSLARAAPPTPERGSPCPARGFPHPGAAPFLPFALPRLGPGPARPRCPQHVQLGPYPAWLSPAPRRPCPGAAVAPPTRSPGPGAPELSPARRAAPPDLAQPAMARGLAPVPAPPCAAHPPGPLRGRGPCPASSRPRRARSRPGARAPCPCPCPGAAWRPCAARPRPGATLARAAAVPLRGVAPCPWLGPGVHAIRSQCVSAALRARVQCFGAARRALGATRSILSHSRRARLPPRVFYA
jgi:hypothetical protein